MTRFALCPEFAFTCDSNTKGIQVRREQRFEEYQKFLARGLNINPSLVLHDQEAAASMEDTITSLREELGRLDTLIAEGPAEGPRVLEAKRDREKVHEQLQSLVKFGGIRDRLKFAQSLKLDLMKPERVTLLQATERGRQALAPMNFTPELAAAERRVIEDVSTGKVWTLVDRSVDTEASMNLCRDRAERPATREELTQAFQWLTRSFIGEEVPFEEGKRIWLGPPRKAGNDDCHTYYPFARFPIVPPSLGDFSVGEASMCWWQDPWQRNEYSPGRNVKAAVICVHERSYGR